MQYLRNYRKKEQLFLQRVYAKETSLSDDIVFQLMLYGDEIEAEEAQRLLLFSSCRAVWSCLRLDVHALAQELYEPECQEASGEDLKCTNMVLVEHPGLYVKGVFVDRA